MNFINKVINKYTSFLFYPLIVCLVSWLHFGLTDSLIVDGNCIEPFWIRLCLFIFIGLSFFIYYKKLYEIIQDPSSINLPILKFISGLFVVLSFSTLPLFSNDFFSMLGYSEAAFKGFNIYENFDALTQTSFTDYINPLYYKLNCKYGPVNVLLLMIPFFLGIKSMFGLMLFCKFIFLIFTLVYLRFSFKLIEKSKVNYCWLILFPIWSMQGLGQFHNDIIGISMLLAGYFFLQERKLFLASVFISLAVLCKFTFIIFLALPFCYYLELEKKLEFKHWAKLGVYFMICLLSLGYLFYSPLIDSFSQILTPIKAMNGERPSSTFADLGAYALMVFSDDFKSNYEKTIPIFKYLGMLIMLFSSFIYLKNFKKEGSHKFLLLSIFTTLILVYSHRFLPWYLMTIPLFLDYKSKMTWIKWLFVISFFAMFQDFAIFLDTENTVGKIVMASSTIVTVLSYLYLIKSRFLNQYYE